MNEVRVYGLDPDSTYYFIVLSNVGQVANNDSEAFETLSDEGYPDYAVAMTEQGTQSGIYFGSFPAWITDAGTYDVIVSKQAGASPAASDADAASGSVAWSGSAEVDENGASLCTPAYAKSICSRLSSVSDAAVQVYLDVATAQIETFCNRRFKSATYIEYADGSGSLSLVLRQRPVTALQSVTLYPHEDNVEDFDDSDFIVDKPAALVRFKLSSFRSFPCGFKTVKAVYTAGYESVPNDLKMACALLANKLHAQSARDPNLVSEKLGDWQATYKSYADADTLISGELKTILEKYRSLAL